MMFGLRLRLSRHTVHPSEPAKPAGKHTGPPKTYGSWCTPDSSPAHATVPHKETTTEFRDLNNIQCKDITLPVKKVRLCPSTPPHEYKTHNVIFEDDETELKDIKRFEIIAKLPICPPSKKPPPPETPQSPVPSSPSRGKKSKGLRLPACCDPSITIDPQGRLYISWLFLVTFCYCYNAWCIILRATFPYQTPENTLYWMMADYACDLVYLLDVAFIKPRLMYLHEGFWVDEPGETRKNYRKKIQYKFDVISLAPLDLLYLYFGTHMVVLRFPRLLKLQTFWEFNLAVDRVLSSPYVVRVGKTLFYIFYLIHINACAYYSMSAYEGLGINNWVYDGQGTAYIRCFYFATKTATSIGKNPKPENPGEYMFMTVAWLMGVFVFALLIGQIRDIIATATRARTDYRKKVDGCTRYLRKLNIPVSVQKRVTCWFTYTYNQQRSFNESNILNSLPQNMKQDVALEVHMSTLSKVELFRDCSDSLLRDLVLKLRPVSYLPGDVVVRRGDVGHQMYIIKSGQCYVMSQDESEVLATLGEGGVFGEVSLLGINGMRRRTATVRSRGYSSLFALSRYDLYGALLHHKEAALVLRRRADNIIRQNAARQAQQRMADRQARKSASLHEESGLRRRRNSSLSSASGGAGPGAGGGSGAGGEAGAGLGGASGGEGAKPGGGSHLGAGLGAGARRSGSVRLGGRLGAGAGGGAKPGGGARPNAGSRLGAGLSGSALSGAGARLGAGLSGGTRPGAGSGGGARLGAGPGGGAQLGGARGLGAGEARRRRRAVSALQRRRLSVVSENKPCGESSDSDEETTVEAQPRGDLMLPKIIFSVSSD